MQVVLASLCRSVNEANYGEDTVNPGVIGRGVA
jgi:hypothetical protein